MKWIEVIDNFTFRLIRSDDDEYEIWAIKNIEDNNFHLRYKSNKNRDTCDLTLYKFDYVNKDTGWLLPPSSNYKQFSEIIDIARSLPQEQKKTMSAKCRKHAEENFTKEKMISEYEKIYQSL